MLPLLMKNVFECMTVTPQYLAYGSPRSQMVELCKVECSLRNSMGFWRSVWWTDR